MHRSATAVPLRAAALALLLAPGVAIAQNAPPKLHGKSILATWNENRMQRQAGVGEFRPMVIPNGLSLYVSSAGRMFLRRSAAVRGGRATGSRDGIGERGTTASGGLRLSQFRGRSLNVTGAFGGAARSITIAFDESFSTCTASVVIGRQPGVAVIRMKTFDGQDAEIQSIAASAATCAVRDGNVFAD